jgi:hypothetical protein
VELRGPEPLPSPGEMTTYLRFGSISFRYDVKNEIKAAEPGTPERRIRSQGDRNRARLPSTMNDKEPQIGDVTGARGAPGGTGE